MDRLAEARAIMLRFAKSPKRYLWTDAFAVHNFIALGRVDLARALVDDVHRVLHAPNGGLRIGKPLPERGEHEPFDDEREWDRDGQYFHYLTKWMRALDEMTVATGDVRFHVRAREIADTAHRAFVYGRAGQRRMFWKMSIDLSRPLVPSMGQHDPVDGFVTCTLLDSTAARLGIHEGARLDAAIADFGSMTDRLELATSDPLGIGGLLVDFAYLGREHAALRGRLLDAAREGLEKYMRQRTLALPASARLAFRELGLAIGLTAAGDAMRPYLPLGEAIESFWRMPHHQHTATWTEHRDINEVMLATSLIEHDPSEKTAEEKRFELLEGLRPRRFSKPVP